MKKKILVFLLAFIAVLALGLFFKEFITASMFDTHAVFEQTFVNITVVADNTPPGLIIVSPTEGATYTATTIDLEYSVSDSGSGVNSVWYNLDNGANITVTANTTFTVAGDADYVLYMFANDRSGNENSTESVRFTVNVPTTPGPTGPSAGGGGGAGGRAVQEMSDFKLDKSLVKVYLTPGDTKEDSLKITNTGNTDIDVSMKLNGVNGISDFLIIRENNFRLKTGEEKSVKLIFIAPERQEPGIYTGQIIVKSGVMAKTVDVIIEIESKMALFDVSVEIPPQFKTVQLGDNVLAKISLYNLGLIKRADVVVEYAIKDFQNNVIVTQKRSLAVETQASLIGELQIPDYLNQGDYVFYTQVRYDGSVAVGSDDFKVVGKKPSEKPGINIYLIILIAVILFVTANLILYYKLKNFLKQQYWLIKNKKKNKKKGKTPKEEDDLKKLADHIRNNLR